MAQVMVSALAAMSPGNPKSMLAARSTIKSIRPLHRIVAIVLSEIGFTFSFLLIFKDRTEPEVE